MTALRAVPPEDGAPGWTGFIPIYVVEPDAAPRQEVAEALRAHGLEVNEFADPAAFLRQFGELEPGCVVAAPCAYAWRTMARKLLDPENPFSVVAVVPAADVAAAVAAMKAGAVDVVTCPLDRTALAAAVRAALAQLGRAAADPAKSDLRQRFARLTRRERQVMEAMLQGDANKAIGARLGISPRTVEVHRAKVMEKLACRSLPELVRQALRAGIAEGE